MLLIDGNNILTVLDAPAEDAAFRYSPNYDGWIEVFFTKEDEGVGYAWDS